MFSGFDVAECPLDQPFPLVCLFNFERIFTIFKKFISHCFTSRVGLVVLLQTSVGTVCFANERFSISCWLGCKWLTNQNGDLLVANCLHFSELEVFVCGGSEAFFEEIKVILS